MEDKSFLVRIVLTMFGGVAVAVGLFGKNFSVADLDGFVFRSGKPVPIWQGRLFFLIVGFVMLAFGLKFLFLG